MVYNFRPDKCNESIVTVAIISDCIYLSVMLAKESYSLSCARLTHTAKYTEESSMTLHSILKSPGNVDPGFARTTSEFGDFFDFNTTHNSDQRCYFVASWLVIVIALAPIYAG